MMKMELINSEDRYSGSVVGVGVGVGVGRGVT